MKTYKLVFLALGLLLIIPVCRGEDWTVNGKTYPNVTVRGFGRDEVEITCDGGKYNIKLSDLLPELQKRFAYDPNWKQKDAQAREWKREAVIAGMPDFDLNAFLEFKEGRDFAQDRFDKSGVDRSDVLAVMFYANRFVAASRNQPSYYYVGAYYQEYAIISKWSDGYVSTYSGKVDYALIKIAKDTKRIAWTGLYDAWHGEPINEKNYQSQSVIGEYYNFRGSSFTYEVLAMLTGKAVADIKALINQNPNE